MSSGNFLKKLPPFATMAMLTSESKTLEFTTHGSFEYRLSSDLLPYRDEPRSASSLMGRSAALLRSAHAETATKIPDRPPERLRSEPDFRKRGNPFY